MFVLLLILETMRKALSPAFVVARFACSPEGRDYLYFRKDHANTRLKSKFIA